MLKDITNQLLREDNPQKLKDAVIRLHALLSDITGIKDSSISDYEAETSLACGKAISTQDAARCVLDYQRTAKFIKGIHAAILEAQNCFPNQTINILYAGCGPFAPLLLPLCTEFNPKEISLTLLDIHEVSIAAARKVFSEFGLSGFVRDYIQCDATTYKAEQQPQIVVIEAMQKALEQEPQVAITMNLATQLCRGGFLIPQKIEIDVCLAKIEEEFLFTDMAEDVLINKNRMALGHLFELSAGKISLLQNSTLTNSSGAVVCLSPKTIEIPQNINDEYRVVLLTNIKVFDEITLDDYESGITYPTILHEIGNPASLSQIEFCYSLSNPVGFKYKVSDDARI